MRKFNLNFGVMLAAIVLFGYTYIAFLGMLYKYDGAVMKAASFAAGIIAIVAGCVYVMVNSKVTKNKEMGIVGQILFGIIIMSVFLTSGAPFTSFLKVIGSRNDIKTEIDSVKASVSGLDEEYNKYAFERVAAYRNSLPQGNGLKVQSLQRRLCPESLSEVQRQRKEWVNQIGDMTIWNILLPQNLRYMRSCVSDWTENYIQLSDNIYDDEQATSFTYDVFNSSLDTLMNSIKEAGYSFWAVFVAILCALVMMLPYWIAIPVKTRKAGPIVWKSQIRHYSN